MCNTCGAQWALHESETEQVSDGDGYCLEPCEEAFSGGKAETVAIHAATISDVVTTS